MKKKALILLRLLLLSCSPLNTGSSESSSLGECDTLLEFLTNQFDLIR